MKKSIRHRSTHFLPLLVVSLAFADPSCAAASEAFQRWAVIGDVASRESGLSDLVHAELAQFAKIELVEREELQLAIQELELSQLHTASQSGQRLQLGSLVKADALLLLSSGTHDGQPFVRVVTCDCGSGARLAYEQFSSSTPKIDELANHVAEVVSQTLARFPAGVQRLITVSPFVAKDFVHDFDHLQNACAAWLSEVLAQQPGLAVVELDEARAIGRELSITASELADRFRPLFIEGEYSSSKAVDSKVSTFRISVLARDANEVVLEIPGHELKLGELSDWLKNTAGTGIVEHLAQRPSKPRSINRIEQVRLLTTRADRFSRLGAYQQAIALREAAILLKTDAATELSIVRDYEALLRGRYLESAKWKDNRRRWPKTFVQPESWESRFAGDMLLYRAVSSHCHFLLRDPTTNPSDYDEIFDALFYRLPEAAYLPNRVQEVLELRDASFWKAVDSLSALSRSEHRASLEFGGSGKRIVSQGDARTRYEKWVARSFYYLFHLRANVHLYGLGMVWRTDDTLDVFKRFLVESRLPECPSAQITRFCISTQNDGLVSFVQQGKIARAALAKLRTTLSSSDDLVWQFYGRCLESSIRWQLRNGDTEERRQLRTAELKSLEAWLIRWQEAHSDAAQFARSSAVMVRRSRQLEQSLPATSERHGWPATLRPISGSDPFPKLRFEKLPVRADWRQLTPCTPEFDVVWSSDSVARLDSNGQSALLYKAEDSNDPICRVVWDGQFLWVGSGISGVRILSEHGRLLADIPQGQGDSIGRSGLPAWEPNRVTSGSSGRQTDASQYHTFQLTPVSPGRCLVTARYGKLDRRWIAIIDFDAGDWRVAVLNESAVRVTNAASTGISTDDSLMPKWFLPLPAKAGGEATKILMGRGLFNSNRAKRPPLLIDIESRKVTSLTHDVVVPALGPVRPTIFADSFAIIPDYFGCWLLKPSRETQSGWSSQEIPYQMNGSDRDDSLPWGVVSGKKVIFPGPVWRSLDPDTGHLERVNAEPLAMQWAFEDYAASGPFGFVAWNRGDHLYRVHLEETAQAKVILNNRYPSVPKELRARHHAAVSRLRDLGATVELRWGRFERSSFLERRAPKEWQSVAWFPSSWKGDERDFDLLRDVYNLRELALVGVPADKATFLL